MVTMFARILASAAALPLIVGGAAGTATATAVPAPAEAAPAGSAAAAQTVDVSKLQALGERAYFDNRLL